jgi:saccharopine dehydrogenase-like NADP-dependent oxidoreductase
MLAAVRIAVLGAGAMGSAAAMLLARHRDVDLMVLDADGDRAERVVASAGHGEAATVGPDGPSEALRGVDAVASCVPYRLNLEVMEAALAAGCPYADLGGLYHLTLRQLELDDRFREAGLPAIAGIGCCPGLSNLLARLAADRLDAVESIDIVDGAREEDESFGVPYSADTILDEFSAPAMVFEDGRLREVPAGSGAVRWPFPEPLGEMEAVYTLHSEIATLPRTIEGVRDVRWRLALPPAIAQGFRLLVDLGLAGTEPVDTPAGPAIPRDVLRAVLARVPSPQGPPRDAEILLVRARGAKDGRPATFTAEARYEPQPEGISAGAFGTAIPIAVAARWLAKGRVPAGVHPPEAALPAGEFVDELVDEGVELTTTLEEDASG